MDLNRKIYIIAGESSGDLLGSSIMREIKKTSPETIFLGVGGETMEASGMKSLFPYYELSLMGFAEVLPHIFELSARINTVVDDVLLKMPDIVITIDSPGFTFRVVKKLREKNCRAKFIHFVAPSVWAYKPERAQKTALLFDALGVLLPFEPPYFEAHGLKTKFIGHPVSARESSDKNIFRTERKIAPNIPLICLLPGSRSNEIKRHMPIFGAAITMLAEKFPNLQIVVPVSERIAAEVLPFFNGCPYPAYIVTKQQEKNSAIAACNVALTKSGTVTLDVAREETPMVVAYRANPISAFIIRCMIKINNACLVNILLNKTIVPEFLQEKCTPENLAFSLNELLTNNELRETQATAMQKAIAMLTAPEGKTTAELAVDLL